MSVDRRSGLTIGLYAPDFDWRAVEAANDEAIARALYLCGYPVLPARPEPEPEVEPCGAQPDPEMRRISEIIDEAGA